MGDFLQTAQSQML